MTDKQIQPVRSRDYQITQRARPRGLWGQVWMVVLQPGYFFRTLPLLEDTRAWLWAAVLILALTGISAVRQEALRNGETGAPPLDFSGASSGGDGGGEFSGALSPEGRFAGAPVDGGGGGGGELPIDSGVPPITPTGLSPDVATTWTTALLAGAAMVLGWFFLTIILSEVTLFNGRAPSLGQNFQVAVWANVPFALLAGLQLIFFAAGGKVGEAGMSGLLSEWEGYGGLPSFWQNVIFSLASRLTIFWLWSLILIYIGARQALHGKRWASWLVVVVWAIFLVVVPVVTGAVKAPSTENLGELSSMESPLDDPLTVPGEENLTGELQGRFADQQDGGLIDITAEPDEFSEEISPTALPESSEAGDQTNASRPIIVKPVPGG